MRKRKTKNENKNTVERYITRTTQKPHRPPTREIIHINEERASQLPREDRPWLLNNIGRKTKATPFDCRYHCNNCGHNFYDNDDKSYRREVTCPYCYKCHFSEQPPVHRERRPQRTETITMNDFIKEMFNS